MRYLNRPLINFFIAAFIYGIYLIILLSRVEFNPSFLVSLGQQFADLNQIPKNIAVWKNSGYDGQFYYRLALNPFTSKKKDFGITFDIPTYRAQRIIYPLIIWTLSLGNPDYIPTILLGVNFIAISLIGLIGGYLAKSVKLHSLWGLVFTIHPGFPYTLSRDLTEILQTLFLLLALLAAAKQKILVSATLLSIAILTREISLVLAISLLITLRKRYFFIPIITFILWQGVLLLNWGLSPLQVANNNLGYPFLGLTSYIPSILHPTNKTALIQICFLVIFAVAVIYSFKGVKNLLYAKIAFCLYSLMAICYTSYIWVADIAFFRALTEFYIIGALILISSRTKLKPLIFLLTAAVWLLSIKQFGYF